MEQDNIDNRVRFDIDIGQNAFLDVWETTLKDLFG